ncbi:hypothetical protein [Mycobacterium lehmannii]|uniref:hypothetical protein n=1 Tax=Mycobacterium lehmannii TaxID=2048550 RepID=UPI0011551513|nr:hypothetical protein [Mycobacterium lehmannii]
MTLLYVITTYGALVAAAIATDFVENPWALAFIGAPLWGLLCYQTQLLVLASVRVNSIQILERRLLEAAQGLSEKEKNQIGSGAGDRISRVSDQPTGLKPANVASFAAIGAASIALAITSLMLVEPKACSFPFILGLVVHAVLGLTLVLALISLGRIRLLISGLADQGPYSRAAAEAEHPTEQNLELQTPDEPDSATEV